jgi:hypothetical protein
MILTHVTFDLLQDYKYIINSQFLTNVALANGTVKTCEMQPLDVDV